MVELVGLVNSVVNFFVCDASGDNTVSISVDTVLKLSYRKIW